MSDPLAAAGIQDAGELSNQQVLQLTAQRISSALPMNFVAKRLGIPEAALLESLMLAVEKGVQALTGKDIAAFLVDASNGFDQDELNRYSGPILDEVMKLVDLTGAGIVVNMALKPLLAPAINLALTFAGKEFSVLVHNQSTTNAEAAAAQALHAELGK